MKVPELNALATEMVGDCKLPNVFFVTVKGNVIMVTTAGWKAHKFWLDLPHSVETALEDRQNGVLCSNEPEEDGSKNLVWHDDYDYLRRNVV